VNLSDGIQTVSAHHFSWWLFVKTLDSDSRVAVAQQTAVRDEITRDRALRTLMSLRILILIPNLLLLVCVLIRKMFMPLKKMASDVGQRIRRILPNLYMVITFLSSA
jgi:two-component system OmpR family sensor kinase